MSWRDFRDELRRDSEEGWRVHASELKVRLAANVLRSREALGWSQAELARRVGTRQPNISKLEGAEINVTADTVGKLAAALGTSVDDLLQIPARPSTGEPGVERIPSRQVRLDTVLLLYPDQTMPWGDYGGGERSRVAFAVDAAAYV